MERLRFGDEYQGLSDFHKKVRTINFNFNDDNINGVFEVDNQDFECDQPLSQEGPLGAAFAENQGVDMEQQQ